MFTGIPALRTLFLYYNNLTYIPQNVFSGMPAIGRVWVTYTYLIGSLQSNPYRTSTIAQSWGTGMIAQQYVVTCAWDRDEHMAQ